MDAQLALALVALLVLLEFAALKWGAESREGFQNRQDPTRRYPPVIDPFFTELAGRDRQHRLLAEADQDHLLATARRTTKPSTVVGIARRLSALTVYAAAAIVARFGLVLLAAGIRLQRLALGRDSADLEPAAW
jgi:hypothetical protein